jgi:stage V sporulation protein D (sporulation-specific penicillin-binding protein)
LEPYIVSEVQDNAGNTVLKQEPTVIRQVIKEETSRMMCGLMQSVVMEGTAKNAQVAGFSIGGKTGTSEKIDVFDESGQRVQDKIVSFVGVAPMDDPQYIVLVALDTPSRSTGIYISGGVMAAPTVGAVMADILPYLGVKHNYTEKDAAGKTVIVEDYTGLAAKEVNALLKQQGITALFRGTEETVTGQIPAAGQSVPGDSQIILYFGDAQAPVDTEVPNFVGMNRSQAAEAAGKAGLYILISGNMSLDPAVVVTSQSESKGTKVLTGTTITLTFADTKVRD